MQIDDLDAGFIAAFLEHREADRNNSVRTRNARLAAVDSFFRFAALHHPEHSNLIERVLAIPPKRFERKTVSLLNDVRSTPSSPSQIGPWLGRRDHALLLTAIQT